MAAENSTTMEYDPFRDYLGLRNLLLPPPKPCRAVTGHRHLAVRETASDQQNDILTDIDNVTDLQVCGREETEAVKQNSYANVDFLRKSVSPMISEEEMHELLAMVQNFFLERLGALPRKRPVAPSSLLRQSLYCAFCRQNGEMRNYYLSHDLKNRFGRVSCPVLRSYICPQCGATGDDAHTLKYCPLIKKEERVPLAKALRAGRNCSGQRRVHRNSDFDN